MVDVLELINHIKDGTMDFEGQKKVSMIHLSLIYGTCTVGFLVGAVKQSFFYTFLFTFVGFILSMIICVPCWPYFAQNPVEWQEPKDRDSSEDEKND